MNAYQLREAAIADLEDIWQYTFEHWGIDQADHYVRSLLDRCQWLANEPSLGKARDDIKQGYCCFPEGRHIVFYKRASNHIEILGFPHQSMDAVAYFE